MSIAQLPQVLALHIKRFEAGNGFTKVPHLRLSLGTHVRTLNDEGAGDNTALSF